MPGSLLPGRPPLTEPIALRPSLVGELARDLRLARILHYVALSGLGAALFLSRPGNRGRLLDSGLQMRFVLFAIALGLAAVFAIVTNNREDLEADRISNPDRPLVRGSVDPGAYSLAGWLSLFCSLSLSLIVDVRMFLGVLAISLGYFVYSCRPFRWKRVPLVAKLLIGANSLAAAVCGFSLAGGEWRTFPSAWAAYLLVPMALSANFVDLKDTEGDGRTGVATLPVLLGPRRARHVIAAATLVSYAMAGVLLAKPWAWPLNAAAAGLHVHFLYREPYDESRIFLVYLSSLFALDLFLLL